LLQGADAPAERPVIGCQPLELGELALLFQRRESVPRRPRLSGASPGPHSSISALTRSRKSSGAVRHTTGVDQKWFAFAQQGSQPFNLVCGLCEGWQIYFVTRPFCKLAQKTNDLITEKWGHLVSLTSGGHLCVCRRRDKPPEARALTCFPLPRDDYARSRSRNGRLRADELSTMAYADS
jgi:hypothetical protein